MRRRRCLVPMNGFYEWQTRSAGKQPYFIRPVVDTFIGAAGLWERWVRPADGEEIDTFTIVTTEANAMMAPLHDRMPEPCRGRSNATSVQRGRGVYHQGRFRDP